MYGAGTAMGAFAAAFSGEQNAQHKREIFDKRSAREEETLKMNRELHKYKMSEAKANIPTAADKQLKARETELKLKQMKVANEGLDYLSKGDAENHATEAMNVANKAQEAVGDMSAKNLSINTVRNIYDEYNQTGKNTNFEQVNNWAKSDPVFGSMIEGDLIQFNASSKTHMQAIRDLAQTQVGKSQIDSETFDSIVEGLKGTAEDGMIMFDSVSNKAWDMVGMARSMGLEKELPQGTVENVSKNIASKLQATTQKTSSENEIDNAAPPWTKQTPGKSGEKLLWEGKDTTKAMKAYQDNPFLGKPPTELVEMDKHNAKLGIPKDGETPSFFDGATVEQKYAWMDNEAMNIAEGTATPQGIARLREAADTVKSESTRKRYHQAADVGNNNIQIDEVYSAQKFDKAANRKLSNIESFNEREVYTGADFKKTRKEYNAKFETVVGLNDAMDTMKDYLTPDENGKIQGIAFGAGMDKFIDWVSVDKDKAEGAYNMLTDAINNYVIGDDGQKMYKVDGKALRAAVNMNSKVGLIVSKFVKDTSGSAVSDDERTFLMGIIAGARAGDPRMMAEAMSSFRNSISMEMDMKQKDTIQRNKFPYTLSKVNDMDMADRMADIDKGVQNYQGQQEADYQIEQREKSGIPVPTAPEEIRKKAEADGQEFDPDGKVIKYNKATGKRLVY